MKLRFTPRALRALDGILSYIESRAPTGASRVQRRLQKIFDLLPRYPDIGKRTSNQRLRKLVTTPYPYLIFYERTESEVIVIGVRHAARDPDSMPDR